MLVQHRGLVMSTHRLHLSGTITCDSTGDLVAVVTALSKVVGLTVTIGDDKSGSGVSDRKKDANPGRQGKQSFAWCCADAIMELEPEAFTRQTARAEWRKRKDRASSLQSLIPLEKDKQVQKKYKADLSKLQTSIRQVEEKAKEIFASRYGEDYAE